MDRLLLCLLGGAALLALASASTQPPRPDATTPPPPRESTMMGNYSMWNDTMENDTMWNDTMASPPPPPRDGTTATSGGGKPPSGVETTTSSGGPLAPGGETQPPPAPTASSGGQPTSGGATTASSGGQPASGGATTASSGGQPASGGATTASSGGQPASGGATTASSGGQPAPGGQTTATSGGGPQPGGETQPPPPPTTTASSGQMGGDRTTMASGNLQDEMLRIQEELRMRLPALNTSDLPRLKEMLAAMSMLPDAALTALRNMTSDSPNVTPADLEFLSRMPHIIGFLNATVLRKMNMTLSNTQKAPICKAAALLPEVAKKVLPNMDCKTALSSMPLDPLVERQLADSILSSEGTLTAADWTQLSSLPQAIRPDDVTRMPADFITNNLGSVATLLAQNQDPAVREGIVEKVRSAVPPSSMTAGQLQTLASGLSSFPPSDIASLSDAAVKGALTAISAQKEAMSPAQVTRLAEKAMNSLPADKTQWSSDELLSMATMKAANQTFLRNLATNEVSRILESTNLNTITALDSNEVRGLRQKVDQLPEFQDKSAFNATLMEKYAPLLSAAQPSTMQSLPSAVLKVSVNNGDLASVNMPKDAARVLARKLESEYSGTTPPADLVTKLGSNVKGMTAQLAQTLPAAALTSDATLAVLGQHAPDMATTTRIKLVERLTVSDSNLCKLGKLGRDVTPDKTASMTGSDVYNALANSDACNVELDDSQSAELFDKLASHIGRPSADNFNFTDLLVGKMGRLLKAMPIRDWNNVAIDSRLPKFIKAVASEDMDPTVTAILQQKASSYYNMGATPNATEDDLVTMGGRTLQRFDSAALQRLGTAKCSSVLKELATAENLDEDVAKLRQTAVNFAVTFCLSKASGTITSGDVKKLGGLVCFLDAATIQRMDSNAMEAASSMLQECPTFPRDVKTAIKQKILSLLGKSSVSAIQTAEEFAMGGALLATGCSSDFASIPQALRGDAMADVVKKIEKRRKMRQSRDMVGRNSELTSTDRQKDEEDDKCAVRSMMEARLTTATRRRRSTTAPTCDEIKMMGSLASALTTAQISAIADQDFRDCAVALGVVTDWSTDQKSALVSKAKAVWGAVSSWNASQVESLGVMAQGLTVSEIQVLALHQDGIAALGQFTGWTLVQLEAGWENWFQNQKSSTHANVAGSDLIVLGEFACGPSTNDIGSLSANAFHVAASSLGSLTSCSQAKLAAYAAKAKAKYGNTVSSWSAGTIDALKLILTGLSGSDLSTLTETQLTRLSTSTIAAIPADKFTSITPTQLRALTSTQVQAVTQAQYNAANPSQQQALREKGYPVTPQDNGAGMATLSALLVALALLLPAL